MLKPPLGTNTQADITLTVKHGLSKLTTSAARHIGRIFQFVFHISIQMHHILLYEEDIQYFLTN